jgi:hypothetical protein
MRVLCLLLAMLTAGCITQTLDAEGRPITPSTRESQLVVDSYGRIVARPTLMVPPHTIVVNGGTPTEREIRLLGVEGFPRSEAPETFNEASWYMRRWIAEETEIFIKPALDSDLRNRVIYGIVYVAAKHPGTDKVVPGGYVTINEAMLDRGLVKVRDLREIDEPGLRERMKNAEDRARREKRGLWSERP